MPGREFDMMGGPGRMPSPHGMSDPMGMRAPGPGKMGPYGFPGGPGGDMMGMPMDRMMGPGKEKACLTGVRRYPSLCCHGGGNSLSHGCQTLSQPLLSRGIGMAILIPQQQGLGKR